MKCRKPIPKDVLARALEVAREQMAAQSDDICARCWNEMTVALHQAGLAPKTAAKVRKVLMESVLPTVDEVRRTRRQDDNVEAVRYGDIWLRDYCERYGLPYNPCRWEEEK